MLTGTETKRTITEEIAYRTGFLEGARTALEHIPHFLDRGLPLADVIEILDRRTARLEDWAQRAVVEVDENRNSAPPKP